MTEQDIRCILVGIERKQDTSSWTALESLSELAELAKTAKLTVCQSIIQQRQAPHSKYYVGKGKIDELKTLIRNNQYTVLITDDELSPAQSKALEKELNIKVMDRTGIILDIFAQRAQTRAAKLQIELAQLAYLLPRLTRLWTHLSRLGGGVGTRGPGETQLEVDRRQIQRRMKHLKDKISKVARNRDIQRHTRHNLPLMVGAIVGYTNAGKSTLINALTDAKVLSEDQLFATLDPTTRKLKLPDNSEILLTDTVGFIQKLPHQLVDAFHATLEELVNAQFILHVVDAAHPKAIAMINTSNELIEALNADHIPQILVLNKIDSVQNLSKIRQLQDMASQHVCISAKEGRHFDDLFEKIQESLAKTRKTMTFHIPQHRMDIVNLLYTHGNVLSESYENGIELTVEINEVIGNKLLNQLHQH